MSGHNIESCKCWDKESTKKNKPFIDGDGHKPKKVYTCCLARFFLHQRLKPRKSNILPLQEQIGECLESPVGDSRQWGFSCVETRSFYPTWLEGFCDFKAPRHQEVVWFTNSLSPSPWWFLDCGGNFPQTWSTTFGWIELQTHVKKVEDEWCMLIHPSCKLNMWSFCWRIFLLQSHFLAINWSQSPKKESPIKIFKNFRHFVGIFFSKPKIIF